MNAESIQEFKRTVRMYWKTGVKKYFSKRETNYKRLDGSPFETMTKHRFIFSPFTEGNEPRLRNALIVNWIPYTGHVRIDVAPIMVKATGKATLKGNVSIKPHQYRKPVQTSERTYRSGQSAYDLIRLLSEGTRASKGKYVASIDARVTKGTRKGTDSSAWNAWFDEFMGQVDFALERLADKIENKIADYLIEEF